jgi:hypothetical protein
MHCRSRRAHALPHGAGPGTTAEERESLLPSDRRNSLQDEEAVSPAPASGTPTSLLRGLALTAVLGLVVTAAVNHEEVAALWEVRRSQGNTCVLPAIQGGGRRRPCFSTPVPDCAQ